jgi:hypothetical protein
VRGSISIKPTAAVNGGLSIHASDVFLDSKRIARIPPSQSIDLDTTKLADGHHELRVVGIANGPIETQGRIIVPFLVNNHGVKLELKVAPAAVVDAATMLRVSVAQPGASSIAIRQNSRVLASVQGEAGEVEIAAATLGRGPTSLQASSEGKNPAVSPPARITVR